MNTALVILLKSLFMVVFALANRYFIQGNVFYVILVVAFIVVFRKELSGFLPKSGKDGDNQDEDDR